MRFNLGAIFLIYRIQGKVGNLSNNLESWYHMHPTGRPLRRLFSMYLLTKEGNGTRNGAQVALPRLHVPRLLFLLPL